MMMRLPRAPQLAPRVMVAVARIENADRLMQEFAELGFDPAPAFSGAEAISRLDERPFDAVILDTAFEDLEAVRRWMDRHRRGVMCVIHDFEAPVAAGGSEDDPAVLFSCDPHTFEITGRVVHAVARARGGRPGST